MFQTKRRRAFFFFLEQLHGWSCGESARKKIKMDMYKVSWNPQKPAELIGFENVFWVLGSKKTPKAFHPSSFSVYPSPQDLFFSSFLPSRTSSRSKEEDILHEFHVSSSHQSPAIQQRKDQRNASGRAGKKQHDPAASKKCRDLGWNVGRKPWDNHGAIVPHGKKRIPFKWSVCAMGCVLQQVFARLWLSTQEDGNKRIEREI